MATSYSNRRQPTRSARTTATRPTNYYAKPFSYRSTAAPLVDNDPPLAAAPGFFPAITHFTDSIAALPKEVQRHFTMLKETEGKAYQPDQAIAELVTAIRQLPLPPHPQSQDRPLPFMQLSIANSVNGSVSGSVVDGVAPKGVLAQPASDMDLPDGTHSQAADEFSERRQDLFARLHFQVGEMTKILDEKNMVLNTANETLGRQLTRLESSFPSIENEVSEDARLGSNTHWALPHMKELRRTNGPTNERRRDVTNVNNLAAAAAAVHETEIAATRSEARREAMLAKRSRMPASDYQFNDHPGVRKQPPSGKIRKTADVAPGSVNGSSSNKRRRVDKPTPNSNERAMSAALHGRLAQPGRTGSRDGSTADASRKKSKPAPVQPASRKKVTPNSPSLASSPTRGTFNTTTVRAVSPARVSSSLPRQNSTTSLVRDAAGKRPGSASSVRKQDEPDGVLATNGAAADVRLANLEAEAEATTTTSDEVRRFPSAMQDETPAPVKREPAAATPTADRDPAPAAPSHGHSRTNSRSAGSKDPRPDKPTTPHNIFADVAPLMARSRSGRGTTNPASAASPSTGSGTNSPSKRSHKRGGGSAVNAKEAAAAIGAAAAAAAAATGTATATSSDDERPDRVRRIRKANVPPGMPAAPAPALVAAEPGAVSSGSDAEEPSKDETEPLYCFCQQPSEGEMIACDNEACPTEWFHLECVQLARAPKNSWFCSEGCKRQAQRGRR